MTWEADTLNRIYDLKQERLRLKRNLIRSGGSLYWCKPRERNWAIDGPNIQKRLALTEEADALTKTIDALRETLWDGIKAKKTFKPNFSSSICRTGRVLPHRSH